MRLLNRSAGRLSRHRRGPLAGLLVPLGLTLSLALLPGNLTPERVEPHIRPRTVAVLGVPLWGRACDPAGLEEADA